MAREIATALLPVAKERLERTRAAAERGDIEFADDRCFTDDKVVWAINEILKDSLPQAEMEANYTIEALEAVTFGELETDFAGASEIYFELLTLRAIDDAKYRDLMRYFARINPGSNGADFGEAGMAVSGADIFELMLMPDLAREFPRDAKAWSADGAEPRMRFTTLLRSLRFEWKSGGTSRLDDDVAEARAIIAAHGDAIDPIERIQFALFEAEFLDSRLDDRVRPRLWPARSTSRWPGRGAVRRAERDHGMPQGDISRLVVDHLRGRFCEGCDALMAPIVARFWSAAVLYDTEAIDGGMSDSRASRDMTAQLAASSGPVAGALRGEIVAELDRLASFVSGQIPRSSPARKVLDRLKPDDRRDMLVAASLFSPAHGVHGQRGSVGEGHPAAGRARPGKKRRALAPIVALIAEDMSQFGADMLVFGQLESYGRILADLRLPLSARVFFESVDRLAKPGHGIEYWNEPNAVGRRQLAKTLAPVYARLGYAFEDKDWKGAAALLDETSALTTERLQQEWRVGNEQVGLLYRAFQPALRLAAQLRFFLATNDKARRSVPDALERTFADLQSAMLGDTALAMQGSIRNSIVRDPVLREAIERRYCARSRLAQMEATEAMVPSKSALGGRSAPRGGRQRDRRGLDGDRRAPDGLGGFRRARPGDDRSGGCGPGGGRQALAVLHAGSNSVFGFVLRPGRKPFLFVSKVEQAELSDRVARLRRDAASFGAVDMA